MENEINVGTRIPLANRLYRPTVTADMVKAYIDNLDLSALAEVLSYGAEAYKRAIIQERARQKAAALPCLLRRELQSTLKDLIEVCEGKNYWHDSTGRAYQYKMLADNTREACERNQDKNGG